MSLICFVVRQSFYTHPCFLWHARLVHQEREVTMKLKSLGAVGLYTKESYKLVFGRDPLDDGLVAEAFTAPNGQSHQVFKARGTFQTCCAECRGHGFLHVL